MNEIKTCLLYTSIGFLPRPFILPAQQLLEELASLDVFHVTGTQRLDAELGIVAIYNRDILSLHIVEITGKQHRHGGLAHTALLVAQGDECASFAHKLSNCGLIIVLMFSLFLLFNGLSGSWDMARYGWHIPVSYTHLDVYKRQEIYHGTSKLRIRYLGEK